MPDDADLFILKQLKNAPMPRQELARELAETAACDVAEAEDYIDHLLKEQILLTNREHSLLMPRRDRRHASVESPEELCPPITGTAHLLGNNGMQEFLASLNLKKNYDNPFYTALEAPAIKGGVRNSTQPELLDALFALQKIGAVGTSPALSAFTAAFRRKFEARKVPLLEALDPDVGISYDGLHKAEGQGLLDGIAYLPEKAKAAPLSWTGVHLLFLKRWLQDNRRGRFDPIVLQEADLDGLEQPGRGLLHPTIAVMYRNAGGKLVIENAGGATASSLAGRFTAFSDQVHDLCREMAAAEANANPDIIFAEVLQRSDTRVENINRRQQIYDYVIPINCFPETGPGQSILPSDLLLSAGKDHLVLESASRGRRVIPRLPTAYNYRLNELGIFRMLCDLQYQGFEQSLEFSLSNLFPGMDYYPRVEYKNNILALARWELAAAEIAALSALPHSVSRLHLFRERKGIPQYITMGTGDQQLVFNLGVDAEALFFLQNLRGDKTTIEEYLLPDKGVANDSGALAAQSVAFLHHDKRVYDVLSTSADSGAAGVTRSFPPGSEWIYLKLYCTPESSDRLLLQFLPALIERSGKYITAWFFIRYHDPEPHIRLRIKSSGRDVPQVVARCNELLAGLPEGLVNEYRYDTYHRELERYGAALIHVVEESFYAGSAWVLRYLQEGFAEGNLRPLLMVYHWCTLFFPDTKTFTAFLQKMSAYYFAEMGGSPALKLSLDRRYKDLAMELRRELETSAAMISDSVAVDCPDALSRVEEEGRKLPADARERLIADLIHMQVNRIYAAEQRRLEGLIYYLLCKAVVSQQARQIRC
jgi:thiopeptide-type bacteriocin biosynthesis protein